MQTSAQFLDAIINKHGFTSDYQLSKHLGIRSQRISNYRNQISHFDEDTCILVAQALNLEPGYVMACIAAERTKSPAAKTQWAKMAELAQRISAVAAALLIFSLSPALILSTETPAPLQTLADAGMSLSASSLQCVLCKIM